jgi:hypothetical protein
MDIRRSIYYESVVGSADALSRILPLPPGDERCRSGEAGYTPWRRASLPDTGISAHAPTVDSASCVLPPRRISFA